MSDNQTSPPVNRTLVFVLGGVVALAALFFLVINPLLLDRDDPDVDVDVAVDADGSEPTIVSPEPEVDVELADPEDEPGGPPAETFEIFNARDPFEQLVREGGQNDGGTTGGDPPDGSGGFDPSADLDGDGLSNDADADDDGDGVADTDEDAGGGDVDTDGDGTSDGDDSDDDDDGVADPDDSDDDGDGVDDDDDTVGDGDDDADVGGTSVTLVEIFTASDGTSRATISVNGTAYTVDEGETFARSFRLLDVSADCATLLFGDNRFTLCEGDSVRK